MSESPLLSKMDALLKKHRGGIESDGTVPAERTSGQLAERAAPPGAWLPVLTDVIERGTPPAMAVAAPVTATPPAEPSSSAEPTLPAEPPAAAAPAPAEGEALAEQLLSELAPRLSEAMEKQVSAELRRNLDQTVASLLSQLDVNVREIVRDAVAEKLKQPRDPST
jgi:hypothetical protein